MMQSRNNSVLWAIMIFICLGLAPLSAKARVIINSQIVSGTVTMVKDNVVELDGNGVYYYPDRKNVEVKLKQGDVVTLKYYVDHGDSEKRKYVEYAPGKNTIAPPPPLTEKSRKLE